MRTFTAAQWSLIISEAQAAKLCLKISRDVEDDLLYCSGENPVTVDAEDYTPRAMNFDTLALGDPSTTGFRVTLDDADAAIRTTWYDERFSGQACLLTLLLRYISGGAWEEVYQVDWKCRYGAYTREQFLIELHAAVGFRPRFGLIVGTRAEFPYLPEPGDSIRIGGGSGGFPGDGGGGGWNPWPWDIP